MQTNSITIGDSKDLLKQLSSGVVDCIYFDPPFNSNRKYRLDTNNQSIGFDDVWTSDQEYIDLIEPMVKECKRVMKKNASFFFHISADQMLIAHMVCAKYFPRIQPIFWKRSRSKNNTKTKLGACTDIIFWCSKTKKPKFNMVYQELDEYYSKNSYKNTDARGNYALGHICYTKTQAPDPEKCKDRYYDLNHDGKTYTPKYGWRMSKEDLLSMVADDRIHFPKKEGANPYKKIYKHESKGKPSTDYWDDLHSIAQGSQERRYPTQKPVSLMERIIKMSTDPGDLVLDPVAGSGTTAVAAKRLGRNYILFDINEEVLDICNKRLDNLE
jgi:DNA modification methylase